MNPKQTGEMATTDYPIEGTSIIHTRHTFMYKGEDLIADTYFNYDENDVLVGFSLQGKDYFYIRDITGNINEIVDKDGTIMVKYSYDAWGVPNRTIGADLNHQQQEEAEFLMYMNPFMYKGYYYDVETSLYYCNSRYYNPEWGRWLNADDVSYLDPSNIGGLNLYAYCGNNPIMYSDPSGKFFISALIFATILGAGLGAIKAAKNNDDILTGALYGGAVGFLSAIFLPMATTGISAFTLGFAFGFAADIGEQLIVNNKSLGDVNLVDSIKSGLLSGTFNVFSFKIDKNFLEPLHNSRDFIGECMSELIYSTIFELGSFTSDLYTEGLGKGLGFNKKFTVNDLRRKLFPKPYYPGEVHPVF